VVDAIERYFEGGVIHYLTSREVEICDDAMRSWTT